jgi:TonB family protein
MATMKGPTPQRLLERLALLGIVGALHVSAIWTLEHAAPPAESPSDTPQSLITVFIKPKISDVGDSRGPDRLKLVVPAPLAAVHIQPPDISFFVSRNGAATMAAPTLEGDGRAGIEPYVAEAALPPGHGATVVLRIEVLDTGAPGRIVVEVSSGSPQADEAAVDYARLQHWYAGRMGGIAQTMWVRWAVRLQA